MGLLADFRDGMKTLYTELDDMKHTVTVYPWVSQNSAGVPTYGSPVEYKAIVEYKNIEMRTQSGRENYSQAKIIFIENVLLKGVDKIVLPNGSTGPILKHGGMPDGEGVLYKEVELGWSALPRQR